MTVTLEEFRPWRADIEARLGRLESVTGSMDEDFSGIQVEFRAQRKMLQALHLTQNEHTKMLREHTKMLTEHSATLQQHTVALGRLETGQAEVLAGVQTIIGLLTPANGNEESGGDAPN